MSAIAFFHKLPKSALPALNAAAVPQKRFLRPPVDDYDKYLAEHGFEAAEYPWSGYVLGPLLEYLVEKHQIDLMHSDYDELSEFVSNARGASHYVFTNAHKLAYLDRLNQPFSESDLRDYYNDFCGCDEPEAGQPMLAGIEAIRQSLNQIDEDSVILFSIR